MRGATVCSGIGAPEMGMPWVEWQYGAEIDPNARAIFKHRHPQVHLYGDFTTIEGGQHGPIDILVGGTPCQSFSIAGLRGGLADDRGNLALQFLKLADRERPRWLVWENVPGVLSSNGGRDFGAILGGMVELGYGIAYRVLDAQHFGVPQRRRRVFVVGHLGDWRRAAAVLFERQSLSGDPAPRRKAGQVAPTIPARSTGGGGLGTDFDCDGGLLPQGCGGEVAPTLNAAFGSKLGLDNQHIDAGAGLFVQDVMGTITSRMFNALGSRDVEDVAHSLRGEGFDAGEDGTGRGTPLVPVAYRTTGNDGVFETGDQIGALTTSTDPNAQIAAFTAKDYGADAGDISPMLRSGSHSGSHSNGGVMPAVAFDMREREGGTQFEGPHDTANIRAASGGSSRSYVVHSAVRRLTPRECERLQGFPDDFTLVPNKHGKPMADGPRYKALGNSMAVPVLRWIGERIKMVDGL